MGSDPQSWLKSKLIRFMFVYWAAIIGLTYAVEWLGRHGPTLEVVFAVMGAGLLLFVVLRIVAWRRRDRMW